MIQDVSIHEAMPGHYLQIAHANQNHSVLRAVLSSGPFVEGWAVYAEGHDGRCRLSSDGNPLFKLTILKMRLALDYQFAARHRHPHRGHDPRPGHGADDENGAFQQEREAAGKWTRASLGSTQLLSYFTGYSRAYGDARGGEAPAGREVRPQRPITTRCWRMARRRHGSRAS